MASSNALKLMERRGAKIEYSIVGGQRELKSCNMFSALYVFKFRGVEILNINVCAQIGKGTVSTQDCPSAIVGACV